MEELATLQHMHKDLEELKREVFIIRHILSEEGKLTESAKKKDLRKQGQPLIANM